ncbi:hypothetical protein [Thioflexithrix psekupsensis]|uniref:DUF3782 domain-containing protein n=1 Tax=Thioflexithrix psekupsensis TaxID=1570016 RepID=A0A251X9A3_9GAMM|nr:hypothetical protein [Thioflexithrix psekupsensis]OUD14520.1 hypothetical protein TPSD3_09495 [Thioflexithrix psekupsensis]
MTDDELKALVASLAVAQKELSERMRQTDEQMRQTDEQMRKTDEQMLKTDEQMRKTDEKLERIGIHLGNVTQNQGDIAEEFFYNSLVKETRLGDLYFDDITRNMRKHRSNIQEEYDLLLTNGDAIAVVEVKYKAHLNDLDKLERKAKNFKLLFPIYQQHKLYAGLASFHINEELKRIALERGYFLLQRCGDLVHTECNFSQLKVL